MFKLRNADEGSMTVAKATKRESREKGERVHYDYECKLGCFAFVKDDLYKWVILRHPKPVYRPKGESIYFGAPVASGFGSQDEALEGLRAILHNPPGHMIPDWLKEADQDVLRVAALPFAVCPYDGHKRHYDAATDRYLDIAVRPYLWAGPMVGFVNKKGYLTVCPTTDIPAWDDEDERRVLEETTKEVGHAEIASVSSQSVWQRLKELVCKR